MRDKYPDVMIEALGAHQLFLRLGHSMENIYLDLKDLVNDRTEIFVSLYWSDVLAPVRIGILNRSVEEVRQLWSGIVKDYNALDNEDRQELFVKSNAYTNRIEILYNMQEAGIPITAKDVEKLKFDLN